MSPADADRFFSRVEVTGVCWLWTAGRTSSGHGLFCFQSTTRVAHRVAYEYLVEAIPKGLVLDHICRIPQCVNPDHLEPVTFAENVRRGYGPTAINARRTHCVNGHEFTPENTKPRKDGRECRTCHKKSRNTARDRRKAAQRARP